MKNLQSIIQEKLRLGKDTKVKHIDTISFEDLIKLFKIANVIPNYFKFCNGVDNWYYICLSAENTNDKRTFYKYIGNYYTKIVNDINTKFSTNLTNVLHVHKCINYSISYISKFSQRVILISVTVYKNNKTYTCVIIFGANEDDMENIRNIFINDGYDDVEININNLLS